MSDSRVMHSIREALKIIDPSHAYFAEFFLQSKVTFVHHLNPGIIGGDAFGTIQHFFDSEVPPVIASERRVYRFARAVQYLCVEHLHDDMSADLICECYRRMTGSVIPVSAPRALVNAYRTAERDGVHWIEQATLLFRDAVVTDGRMRDLLLAWGLLRAGFPFIVGIDARRNGSDLTRVVMQACQRCLGNYFANADVTGLDVTTNKM